MTTRIRVLEWRGNLGAPDGRAHFSNRKDADSGMSTIPVRSTSGLCRERLFLLGLLLLFGLLSLQYSLKALDHRSAILRWQEQLRAMDDGVDIATRYTYPNPPVMGVILLPLAKLPPLAAALTWFYLKVAMTFLSLHWVFRLVAEAGRPFPPWAKAATVLLGLTPVVGDLQHGNVNLFILFLVVGALAAFQQRRDFLSGAILALAICCKVTPALFVPYFLWKRSWRVLAGVAAGILLFLWPGIVPSLRIGFEQNQQQLVSWYREMVRPFVIEGKVTSEHPNQSLPGLVYRLGTASPSFSKYQENVYTPTGYHNLLSLDPALARWLVKGCMAAFALLVVVACRTPTTPRQGWRLGAEFALVVLGMLLFSERTWKHHCVTLLLPFALITYYLGVCRPSPRVRGALVGVLVAAAALMASTGTMSGSSLGKTAQVYGAYTVANLILTGTIAFLLFHGEYERDHPTKESQV